MEYVLLGIPDYIANNEFHLFLTNSPKCNKSWSFTGFKGNLMDTYRSRQFSHYTFLLAEFEKNVDKELVEFILNFRNGKNGIKVDHKFAISIEDKLTIARYNYCVLDYESGSILQMIEKYKSTKYDSDFSALLVPETNFILNISKQINYFEGVRPLWQHEQIL